MNAYDFAASNRTAALDELKDLLRIPSISALGEYKSDVARAATWVADHLKKIGLTRVEVSATAGHPVVYGEWLGAAGAPTVLIYGHYDVQPPYNDMATKDPSWQTEPFDPVEKDGNLYARGSADDKGQFYAHMKAVAALLQAEGTLPVNVKFLIEGEEETGSTALYEYIPAHAEMLKADVCVISDSHMLATDRPSIVNALRGLMYFEVQMQVAKSDLHSGSYGGLVLNAAQLMAETLAKLHAPDGSVAVPGFYDGVVPLSPAEREAVAQVPWTDDELLHEAGTLLEQGERGYSRRERVGLRPTLEINGMVSGFTGEGSKTVLPSKAMAKISCRLVANQEPDDIFEKVSGYIKSLVPEGVTLSFKRHGNGFPVKVDIDSPQMQAAVAAVTRGFGAAPVFLPEGGSIPIVATIRSVLNNIPVLLVGFGLPDDNLHAPDEKFSIDQFYRGIDTSIALLEALGRR